MASRSLLEFAGNRLVGSSCRICDVPERQEIDDARKLGVSIPAIIAWMEQERGYEKGWITKARLANHFEKHDG